MTHWTGLRGPRLGVLLLASLALGCTDGRKPPPDGPHFVERSRESGLGAFRHTDGSEKKRYYITETLASSVLLFDYDLDGDLDVYLLNGRPLPPTPEGNASVRNALYENDGHANFRDVTEEKGCPGTGFASGGAVADYDNDGDLDFYICQYEENVLYQNQGPEEGYRFVDVMAQSGCDDKRFSAGAAFFDMDRDGDLDVYVSNYCEQDWVKDKACIHNGMAGYCAPSSYPGLGDSMFRNEGDGTFVDITKSSGIYNGGKKLRGMGVLAVDFDEDGWLDIYVANDGSENYLFHNQRDGTFAEVALEFGVALSVNGDEQGSMGLDAADFDRDGHLDFFVTNYQKQLDALYLGDGEGYFEDAGMGRGLAETCLPMVSWGVKMFDFDHDGWLDVFIANGHLEDNIEHYDQSSTYLQQNQLFKGNGKGGLVEITDEAGPALEERFSSRGAAFGDLDNDGDVDIVVCNSRDRPSFLVNEGGNERSWIMLDLRGKTNRFAVGAEAAVRVGGATFVGYVHSGAGYVSQHDYRLHFGLADAERVDEVRVKWPEGHEEIFGGLEARRVHRLEEGGGKLARRE